MPKPRAINTKKRNTMLTKMKGSLKVELNRLDTIITDLEKAHVDNADKAKTLLKTAKSARKSLDATVAAL